MNQRHEQRHRASVVRDIALLVAGCFAIGVLVGVVWGLIAPRTQLTVKQGELLYAQVTEGAVGGVLSLACLLCVCGIATGAVVAIWQKAINVELLLGVIAGGLLGSVIAWKSGLQVANGAENGTELSAAGRAEGVTFSGLLELDAPGVLGLWSLCAVVVLWIVLWRRAKAARRRIDDVIRESQDLYSADA